MGGRACSYHDHRTGIDFDNCQHVLLGCCDATIDFLNRLGTLERVRFQDTTTISSPSGERLSLASSRLAPPYHLLPSVILSRFMSLSEKLSLGRALRGIRSREPEAGQSALDYLRALRCPDRLVETLFEPMIAATLNEPADVASAHYTRMVLTKALMESREGYRLGVALGPMSEVFLDPAARYIGERGGAVRLNARVTGLDTSGSRISHLLVGEEAVQADQYVAAVPPSRLRSMGVETSGVDLQWRPIVGVHLFYERPLGSAPPNGCAAGEPFGWVFNKSRDFGLGSGYLLAVASAAGEIAGYQRSDLVHLARRAVERVIPGAGKTEPDRAIVIREMAATFSTAGDCDSHRPEAATGLGNLSLAGDWIDTGWPSTIESAVRSGQAAARRIISRE